MNIAILVGRLTRDPELKFLQSRTARRAMGRTEEVRL